MIWKLLLDLGPFIWECFFGKKIPKEELKEEAEKDKKEAASIGFLRKILQVIQNSHRVALLLVLLLAVSVFLNYHFVGKIFVLIREEASRRETRPSAVSTQPMERSAYYEQLVQHLNNTYQSGE